MALTRRLKVLWYVLRVLWQKKFAKPPEGSYAHKVKEASDFVGGYIGKTPLWGLVLGSGLGDLVDAIQVERSFKAGEIPHYPRSTVEGHRGWLMFGTLEGVPLVVQCGRVHFYEGYSLREVVFPTHLMANLGIKALIVTNAAGAINPLFRPGDLMLIADHINFFWDNPLIGEQFLGWGHRFVDMSQPYDSQLIALAEGVALEYGLPLRKGVLFASKGPSYETAAEVRMIRRLGGDAATMSTVPEVIAARQRGLRVLGISCISNMATGLASQKLSHEEVMEIAAQVRQRLLTLLRAFIQKATPHL